MSELRRDCLYDTGRYGFVLKDCSIKGGLKLKNFIIPPEQQWENLTLANDFAFCHIMHDEKLCTEMIKRILPDYDIGRIEFTESQRTSKHSPDSRGVRFDVYAKSDNQKIFDCEVQTSDKHDLPRRTRAYHIAAGLDVLGKDVIKRSGSYDDLPDVFVIFICTFDHFHHDRHIYTFYNRCQEDNSIILDDGAFTVFLNAKGKADDVSSELKAFLDFIMGKVSDDPFIMELEEKLEDLKRDSTYRRNYMLLLTREDEKLAEGRKIGREEGIEEGREIGREEGIEEGREIGLAEAAAKYTDKMHSLLNRLITNGFSREEAINLLGENIQ